jgi:hypothetical protein
MIPFSKFKRSDIVAPIIWCLALVLPSELQQNEKPSLTTIVNGIIKGDVKKPTSVMFSVINSARYSGFYKNNPKTINTIFPFLIASVDDSSLYQGSSEVPTLGSACLYTLTVLLKDEDMFTTIQLSMRKTGTTRMALELWWERNEGKVYWDEEARSFKIH